VLKRIRIEAPFTAADSEHGSVAVFEMSRPIVMKPIAAACGVIC
jgi:hypothetical protein